MATTIHPPQSSYSEEYISHPFTKQEKIVPRSEWEKPSQANPNAMVTRYHDDYPAHEVHLRQPHPKANWNGFGDPFSGITTHQSEFKYVPTEPAKRVRPRGELSLDSGPMEVTSTIHDTFKQWTLPERYIHPRETYHPPTQSMDCKSSYSADYLIHNGYVKLPPIRPQERKDSLKPFSISTENKDAFKGYGKEEFIEITNFKPRREYQEPSEKMLTATSYSEEFTPRRLEKVDKVKPHDSYDPPREYASDFKSSYSNDFLSKHLDARVQAIRPIGELQVFHDSKSTESMSTYKREFQDSPTFQEARLHRSESFKPLRVYEPPKEKFVSSTSYSGEYSPRKLKDRVQSFKPHRIYAAPELAFATETTYDGEFNTQSRQPLRLEKRESFKPKKIYEAPTEPFSQISSYKFDFKGQKGERFSPIRPTENQIYSITGSEKMDSETTSRKEFTSKSPERVEMKKPLDTPDLIKDSRGIFW